MSKLKLLTYPNPTLRTKSEPVTKFDKNLEKMLDDMVETMYSQDGIGLAAIQVGRPIRAIVLDVSQKDKAEPGLIKLINPEIVEFEEETTYNEGCLSVPDINESVVRHKNIKLKAHNEKGEECIIDASGLFSVCLQHELDHLDGILFIDRLSRLKRELLKSKLKKLEKGKA